MMGLILLVAVSAAPVSDAGVASTTHPPQTLKIDILVKPPKSECEAQTGDEIVVCGVEADNESYRLRPIANAEKFEKDESVAEFEISQNVRAAAEAESEELQQGILSKRMMARIKIAF